MGEKPSRNLFDDIEEAVVGNYYRHQSDPNKIYKIVSVWDQVNPRFDAHLFQSNGQFIELTSIPMDRFLRKYEKVALEDLPWRQKLSQLAQTAQES